MAKSKLFPASGITAALLVLGVAAAPLAGSADLQGSVELPALASPASGEHQPGRVVWMDLVIPSLPTEERFYTSLLGWSFRQLSSGQEPYALAMLNGQPVASLIQRPLPRKGQRGPAWLGFLSADDLDAATRAALAQGGKQRSPVRMYPQRGRQVLLEDPQGVVFGVVSATGGDPPDTLALSGQWIWSALFTGDPDNEAAFYQKVFGYDVYDLTDQSDQARLATEPNAQPNAQQTATDSSAAATSASTGAVEHLELASADYARASVNGLSAEQAQRHARWLYFVRVDDAAAAVAKAQSLGARVLVQPRADRQGGRVAVIADPAGALLGLMEWSDADADTSAVAGDGSGGSAPTASGANTGSAAPPPGAAP
jgi:predicted enzyme related to lactoylglutathione lyase